jgi:hypothetical protein
MFIPLFIAILLGLACPLQPGTSCSHNTTVSVNSEGDPGDPGDDGGSGDDDGTGGGSTGTGTGGDTGNTPPPKP